MGGHWGELDQDFFGVLKKVRQEINKKCYVGEGDSVAAFMCDDVWRRKNVVRYLN